MQHSPPTTRAGADRLEAKLKNDVKTYRRQLQKISKTKTKILCALRDEGCREAAELLQTPAREPGVERCRRCVGCHTLETLGPCFHCPGCQAQEECTEHSRLCFAWRQPTATFVVGSVITGVSSLCNVQEYDLTKYKDLVEQLGEMSLEIECTLDEFPVGSTEHRNDRYNATKRTRDMQNEEEQRLVIETLLNCYQDERSRLDEVQSEAEEPIDDTVEVDGGLDDQPETEIVRPRAPYGLLSQTNTLYQFGGTPGENVQPGVLLDLDNPPPATLDDGLGLGANLGLEELGADRILTGFNTAGSREDGDTRTKSPVSPSVSPRPAVKTSDRVTFSPPSQPVRLSTPQPTTAANSFIDAGPTRSTAIGCITTTSITTTTTATTPSMIANLVTPQSKGGGAATLRRRSSSEGDEERLGDRRREGMQDQVFKAKQLVATRSKRFAQDLNALSDRLRSRDDGPRRWAEAEFRLCREQLDQLEDLESTIWVLLGKLEGRSAQRQRMDKWREWYDRQTDRLRRTRDRYWETPASTRTSNVNDRHGQCSRSSGHVEKVKLPLFSGRQEEFSEFRSQFRELCRRERYTPVLEMAQLKLKLPKEALATIAGLRCPEEAWLRLEELYGNRELSILSALRSLREFKSAKSSAHEQVLDLVSAVQKCKTELKNVEATQELLGDRESLACIVQHLPATIRDKWYDKKDFSIYERAS